MDIKERIRRSPPSSPQAVGEAAASAPGHPRGRKARVPVLPLSVACGVTLLLLAGVSAARRGAPFSGADPTTLSGNDDRGGFEQAGPRDGT
jgi:xyloglucan fucosyltransferase